MKARLTHLFTLADNSIRSLTHTYTITKIENVATYSPHLESNVVLYLTGSKCAMLVVCNVYTRNSTNINDRTRLPLIAASGSRR